MADISGRRPLKVRQLAVTQRIAQWLCARKIRPNHISLLSLVFAAAAAAALFYSANATLAWRISLLVLAALCVQGRLLCNLFDGLVAVEGGQASASGELFNDIPDRIADPMILVALGYAASAYAPALTLGWLAGLLAVLTAYVRVLAVSIAAPADFCGPMAKQQRMALVTLACLCAGIELALWHHDWTLRIALWILVLGSAWTLWRRIRRAYLALESGVSE